LSYDDREKYNQLKREFREEDNVDHIRHCLHQLYRIRDCDSSKTIDDLECSIYDLNSGLHQICELFDRPGVYWNLYADLDDEKQHIQLDVTERCYHFDTKSYKVIIDSL
jgi:hypothetical protein